MGLVLFNMFKLSSYYFTDRSNAVLLLCIFCVILFHVCLDYSVLSIPGSLVISRFERADL